jgi:hypothetical protein
MPMVLLTGERWAGSKGCKVTWGALGVVDKNEVMGMKSFKKKKKKNRIY